MRARMVVAAATTSIDQLNGDHIAGVLLNLPVCVQEEVCVTATERTDRESDVVTSRYVVKEVLLVQVRFACVLRTV